MMHSILMMSVYSISALAAQDRVTGSAREIATIVGSSHVQAKVRQLGESRIRGIMARESKQSYIVQTDNCNIEVSLLYSSEPCDRNRGCPSPRLGVQIQSTKCR